MQAELVVTAMLDSMEDFMQSYKATKPIRYEFVRVYHDTFDVKRWNWEGTYNYIGSVKQLRDGRWIPSLVASRTFYGRHSGNILNQRRQHVPDWSAFGAFQTREEAADKLWELYEIP